MPDQYIPLRRSELVDILCASPEVAEDDRERLRLFCRLLVGLSLCEHNRLLERLKVDYALFDPDADIKALTRREPEDRERQLADLFAQFATVLERARYHRLTRDDITPTIHAHSDWGVLVDVDFHIFERLVIFARGDAVERRRIRKFRNRYREQEVDVPIWQRLVMILKLRKHPQLAPHINTEKVYLQLFKNIPKLDITMLLPGARVRMSRVDRSRIGLPLVSGMGMALYNIAHQVYNIAEDILDFAMRWMAHPSMVMWGLATGAISYGSKSYWNYLSMRQRYHLNLTQVLYFQNLDTNTGVLHRVLDEAQEQECRESLLAYFLLWLRAPAEGMPRQALRDAVHTFLTQRAELHVEFEIDDALADLEKMGLLEKTATGFRVQPLRPALELLENAWKTYFHRVFRTPDPWAAIREQSSPVLDYSV
jgi:hypothetical protein